MKTLMLMLGCLILAALITPLLYAAGRACLQAKPGSPLRSITRALGLHAGILQTNALTDGIHPTGVLGHLKSDAAHSARHLAVKRGSDADHFAVTAAATDVPLGICIDTPSAAEESASVALFGSAVGTLKAVGNAVIAADAEVFAAANGKLSGPPTGAGTYWKVGKAITGCAGDGGPFEIAHHRPTRVVVLASSADLTAIKAAVTASSELMFLA